jgi:hypothetical protein
MKYLKYLIVYLSLLAIFGLFIFAFYAIFKDDFGLTLIQRDIIMGAIIPLAYLYHLWKPFKLTGNLDLYIKEKWNNYIDSQKTCPNCDRVVKKDELTSDGKCVYCKNLEDKKE